MTPYEKEKLVIERTKLQIEKQNRGRLTLLCQELEEIKRQLKDLIGEKKVYNYTPNHKDFV